MRPISKLIKTSSFSLFPAGCLHWPIGEKDLLQKWVEELRATPDSYGILMGDSMDVARTHYRNHIRSYRDDDNSQEAFDAYVTEEAGKLAKVLKPVASKILGIVRGNHYWEFLDGTNSEQLLCRLLGIPYLGVMGLIRLDVHVTGSVVGGRGSHTQNMVIFAHHTGGSSGGRTTGGDVNGLTRQESTWDADIYLLGHTHRRIAFKEPVMSLTRKNKEPRVVERSRVFCRTGAFLKGFGPTTVNAHQRHTPAYAEEKALRPTDLGWVRIDVKWRSRDKMYYPEYTVTY